jgi:hypothetical protein
VAEKFISLTLQQACGACLSIICIVAGATYTITKLATDSYVGVLLLQTSQLDRRVQELQQQVVRNSGAPSKDRHEEETLDLIFVEPRADAKVDQFTDVLFSLKGKIPTGYQPILVVRDPLGQYWSWGPSTGGRIPRVQMGVTTDSGQRLEIGVIITNADMPRGRPIPELPRNIFYKSINVVRN